MRGGCCCDVGEVVVVGSAGSCGGRRERFVPESRGEVDVDLNAR
jgi:hypothetical protein